MHAWPAWAIMLVTDRRRLAPGARTTSDEIAALDALIDEAIGHGVDAIQIRERDLDARTLTAMVVRTVRRAEGTSTRVLVNDRADVARAAGASGVHLPAAGPPAARVRSLGGEAWIVGRSIHNGDDAGGWADADYAVFGAVFSTASKPDAPPAGLAALRRAAMSSSVPVFAIGGITPETARASAAAGAAGVAAIGVFLSAGSKPEALGVARAVRALGEAGAVRGGHAE